MKSYSTVLSIAGSDPSGGAGIQADIKTCCALGCYAMTAIAALTAQNTSGVRGVLDTSGFLTSQLDAVLDDIIPDAVKIGMLPDVAAVEATATAIAKYSLKNIVLDPVMVATSGDALSCEGSVAAMARMLMPLATVVTPNIPEAEVLSGMRIGTMESALAAARKIAGEYHPGYVLVKGGHNPGQGDILLDCSTGEFVVYDGEYVDTANTHGTGCTLSSAIACGLAGGMDVPDAVGRAKRFIIAAIKSGADYRIGHGHGPVNHLIKL